MHLNSLSALTVQVTACRFTGGNKALKSAACEREERRTTDYQSKGASYSFRYGPCACIISSWCPSDCIFLGMLYYLVKVIFSNAMAGAKPFLLR